MGALTFTPPRGPDDPEVQALAATFAHDDGVAVLHETIQYLRRALGRRGSLAAVAGRDRAPDDLIWGVYDTVSPIRVANHVWHEHLMFKPGPQRAST